MFDAGHVLLHFQCPHVADGCVLLWCACWNGNRDSVTVSRRDAWTLMPSLRALNKTLQKNGVPLCVAWLNLKGNILHLVIQFPSPSQLFNTNHINSVIYSVLCTLFQNLVWTDRAVKMVLGVEITPCTCGEIVVFSYCSSFVAWHDSLTMKQLIHS